MWTWKEIDLSIKRSNLIDSTAVWSNFIFGDESSNFISNEFFKDFFNSFNFIVLSFFILVFFFFIDFNDFFFDSIDSVLSFKLVVDRNGFNDSILGIVKFSNFLK